MKNIIFLFSLILFGCGAKNGDPLKDYPELKNDVPYEPQKVRTQNFASCGTEVQADKLSVVEGETLLKTISITSDQIKITENFVLEQPAPHIQWKSLSTQFDEKTKKYKTDYELRFDAQKERVSALHDSKEIMIRVLPATQRTSVIRCTYDIQIEILKNKTVPSIAQIKGSAHLLKSEDINKIGFEVFVAIQQLDSVEDLKIIFGFDRTRQNQENPILNLNTFEPQITSFVAVQKNLYKADLRFDNEKLQSALAEWSKKQRKPGNKNFLELHMTLQAHNTKSKQVSIPVDLTITLLPNSEAPATTALSEGVQ